MIKLIIFDLDDTLYNEKEYVVSGFRSVSKKIESKYGLNFFEVYSALLESFFVDGRGKNFDKIVDKFGLSPKIVPDLVKTYRGHEPEIHIKDEDKLFLKKLSQKYKLCLITDGWEDVQKNKVSVLKLDSIFDLVLYSQRDGIKYAKPHNKFFVKALNYFKVKKEEAVMIGDDYDKDIVGANGLGIKTFQVENFLDKKEKEAIKFILKDENIKNRK